MQLESSPTEPEGLDGFLLSNLQKGRVAFFLGSDLGPPELRHISLPNLVPALAPGVAPAEQLPVALKRYEEIARGWEAADHPLLDLLLALPCRAIITTLTDRALTRSLDHIGKPWRSAIRLNRRSLPDDEILLVRMKGTVDDPAQLILEPSDLYRDRHDREFIDAQIQDILDHNVLILFGYASIDSVLRDRFLVARRETSLALHTAYLVSHYPDTANDWMAVASFHHLVMTPLEFVRRARLQLNQQSPDDVTFRGSLTALLARHPTHLTAESERQLQNLAKYCEVVTKGLVFLEHPDAVDSWDLWTTVLSSRLKLLRLRVIDAAGLEPGQRLEGMLEQTPAGEPVLVLGLEFLVGSLRGQQRQVLGQLNQLREALVTRVLILLVPKRVQDLFFRYARDLLDWANLRIFVEPSAPLVAEIGGAGSGLKVGAVMSHGVPFSGSELPVAGPAKKGGAGMRGGTAAEAPVKPAPTPDFSGLFERSDELHRVQEQKMPWPAQSSWQIESEHSAKDELDIGMALSLSAAADDSPKLPENHRTSPAGQVTVPGGDLRSEPSIPENTKTRFGLIKRRNQVLPTQSRELRTILAATFYNLDDINLLVHDVGLNRARIPFGGSPEVVWFEILNEAEKQGNSTVLHLLDEVIHRAPVLADHPAVRARQHHS